MADFFRGLAGGFQSGLQLGQAMRDKQQREELAQVYAKPESFTDYTPAQQQQIQGLQASGAYDVEAVPGAEGVAPTLRYVPKQGLDLQGDMPAAGIEIAPQQVQRYAGRVAEGQFDPAVLQGLRAREAARVVGAYGDPVRAAQLEADALRMEREAVEAPLRMQTLRQQVELGGYQVKGAKRTDEDATREANFAAFASKNPEMSVADLKTAAFKEFGYTPQQWEKTVTSRLNIDTAEMGLFKKGIQSKLKGKNLSQLGELYNSDPDFDDKTDLAIVPGKGGAVTLNFIDKATKKITSTASFKNEALATEYLNKQAVEPENLGSWMLNLKKVESAIEASEASAAKDRAMGGLYAQGGAGASKTAEAKIKSMESALGRKLTEEEKLVQFGIEPKKREFNPKDYSTTLKNFMDAGLSMAASRMEADRLYGRAPETEKVDAGLQAANKSKAVGTASAPVEVRPGESRMTAPGAVVRGPLDDFLRESRRGLFGGVEYFYTDPLTKKRYTTEQYNQLLNQ